MVDFLFGFCIAMCLIMIIFANAMAMRRDCCPVTSKQIYLLMTNEITPMRETFTF